MCTFRGLVSLCFVVVVYGQHVSYEKIEYNESYATYQDIDKVSYPTLSFINYSRRSCTEIALFSEKYYSVRYR